MRLALALALGFVLALAAGSALADPASSSDRYEDLLASFDEALGAAEKDDAVRLEVSEIALVAEELSAEGETDLAVTLLEEAIALLRPPDRE